MKIAILSGIGRQRSQSPLAHQLIVVPILSVLIFADASQRVAVVGRLSPTAQEDRLVSDARQAGAFLRDITGHILSVPFSETAYMIADTP